MKKESTALIVIDLQNDFCPNGQLAVPNGDEIVQPINQLLQYFVHIVYTQDWHPKDHSSFASNHQNCTPYQTITMDYGPQILWPDHCVQGTFGAEFHPLLDLTKANLIIRKGSNRKIDSYSAFMENDQKTPTGLHGYLSERRIANLVIVGLATDFCVQYSGLDAKTKGYDVTVLLDCCRGIDLDGSLEQTKNSMKSKGVQLSTTKAFLSTEVS